MICTIDIGNTSKKYAIWQNQKLVENGIWNEDYAPSMLACNTWVVSNVSAQELEVPASINVFGINNNMQTPFANEYKTTQTWGADRMACVAGACSLGYEHAIIIDLGTCIKTEVLLNNTYKGGSIAPGYEMRLKSMHQLTGKLPLIPLQAYTKIIGANTQECMLSGAITGANLEIETRINQLMNQYGTMPILCTGGHLFLLENQIKHKIFAQPLLIHQGLLNLYTINV